jgi:catechol 2,3-dioxygenase-like lactoylglutathione lyase family enzyme
MSLHGLLSVTIGVPNVEETAAYYTEFGLAPQYYSDMDCIVDDQLWTPEDLEGARGLFAWGPPPPPSFMYPEDLAAMMTGAHSAR